MWGSDRADPRHIVIIVIISPHVSLSFLVSPLSLSLSLSRARGTQTSMAGVTGDVSRIRAALLQAVESVPDAPAPCAGAGCLAPAIAVDGTGTATSTSFMTISRVFLTHFLAMCHPARAPWCALLKDADAGLQSDLTLDLRLQISWSRRSSAASGSRRRHS